MSATEGRSTARTSSACPVLDSAMKVESWIRRDATIAGMFVPVSGQRKLARVCMCVCVSVCVCVCVHVSVCVCLCIYIYIERERERDHTYVYTAGYIYPPPHTHTHK